jgi:hypothetical protein
MVNVDNVLGKYDQISAKELADVVEMIQKLGSDNDTYCAADKKLDRKTARYNQKLWLEV